LISFFVGVEAKYASRTNAAMLRSRNVVSETLQAGGVLLWIYIATTTNRLSDFLFHVNDRSHPIGSSHNPSVQPSTLELALAARHP